MKSRKNHDTHHETQRGCSDDTIKDDSGDIRKSCSDRKIAREAPLSFVKYSFVLPVVVFIFLVQCFSFGSVLPAGP